MRYQFLCVVVFVFGLVGCIELYDPGLEATDDKLVVEGLLTNQNEAHYIYLSRSAAYKDNANVLDKPVDGAEVWLSDELKTKTNLVNFGNGKYVFPRNFKGKVGKTYQLNIKLADGNEYISEPQTMTEPPDIENVEAVFEYDTRKIIYDRGSFRIDITTKDPTGKGNYYKWNWRNFKPINICNYFSRTTQGGVVWYEQKCCEKVCFEITTCKNCINILSDERVNRRMISNNPIGNIPYESTSPYYLLIDQYAMSKSMFEFWSSLKNQTGNVGGIFDTTPAKIPGNIYNVKNKNEQAIGYFQVSGVKQKVMMINRGGQSRLPVPRTIVDLSYLPAACQACEAKDNHTTIIPPLFPGF